MIEIRKADNPEMLDAVRSLVRAHMLAHSSAHSAAEIEGIVAALPAPYLPPAGGLWVACDGEDAVGCVALHPLAPDTAEIKRMYVRPERRGHGIARQLTAHVIAAARDRGYARVRLGTLATMITAQKLYEGAGFTRIPSYRPDEFGETWFYELGLDDKPRTTDGADDSRNST